MKKITSTILIVVLMFSLVACTNKTEQNYKTLVEYIKTNGEKNGTTYFIKTDFSDLGDVWKDSSDYITISIDSSNILHLKETYSNTITHIEYQLGNEECKIETINTSDNGTQYISTAKFSIKVSPSSSTLKNFQADNTSLGVENAKTLLAGSANLLLVRTDMALNFLNIGVTLNDIGLPKGTLNYY